MTEHYSDQDLKTDIARIINGKCDELNPLLHAMLLEDFAGNSALFHQFTTTLSRAYVDALDRLSRHPVVLQQVGLRRAEQETKVDEDIKELTEKLQAEIKTYDKQLQKLQRFGPRRKIKPLLEEKLWYEEKSNKRITFLKENRTRIAETKVLQAYGCSVAERITTGLTHMPLSCVLATFNQLKEVCTADEYEAMNAMYRNSQERNSPSYSFLVNVLSQKTEAPGYRKLYAAFLLSRQCGETLGSSLSRHYPDRLLTPSIPRKTPDLSGRLTTQLLSTLSQVDSVRIAGDDIEVSGLVGPTTFNLAQLTAECPELGALISFVTTDEKYSNPNFAALYLRGTVHHWMNSARRLPGYRDAYLDNVYDVERTQDARFKVYARVHSVSQVSDTVVVANPPFVRYFSVSPDWLNAAYPGAVKRMDIGAGLGLTGKELSNYVFADKAPPQDAVLPEDLVFE